jgi:hypothetical protein
LHFSRANKAVNYIRINLGGKLAGLARRFEAEGLFAVLLSHCAAMQGHNDAAFRFVIKDCLTVIS